MNSRLELAWPNKDQFLLVPRDADGKPVWVDPAHPAASEVRLSRFTDSVGTVSDDPYADNLLFTGDSLDVLRILTEVPEYRRQYRGKVALAYLDPPFNTGETFEHYDDWMEHSTWLSFMRDRLLLLKEMLAPHGSIWVHLDDAEVHRMRALMDEVFGAQNFIATVVWQKKYSRDNRPAIGAVHDYILVYAPSGSRWKNSRNRLLRTAAKEYKNLNNDPRGDWRPIPLDVQGGHATAAQFYEVTTPSGVVHSPAPGRAWSVTKPRMDELIADGKVYFGKKGDAKPNLIRYLADDEGLVPWTWWPHEEVGHTDGAKKELIALFPDSEPFSTPKPERLLERVIHVATQAGDIVLDCFAGSGTTAAVAHKMGRRWVTCEVSPDTVASFTKPRLEKVVAGSDRGGISAPPAAPLYALPENVTTEDVKAAATTLKALFEAGLLEPAPLPDEARKRLRELARKSQPGSDEGWQGGGGFRTVEVRPSMYEMGPGGMVLLADWATNGSFSRAVAGQLGFEYEDASPFCGRRGRMRLVVLDGAVGPEEITDLVARLDERERLTVVAKVVLPTAEETLAKLSPGSRVKKAPRDLLVVPRRRRAPKTQDAS